MRRDEMGMAQGVAVVEWGGRCSEYWVIFFGVWETGQRYQRICRRNF